MPKTNWDKQTTQIGPIWFKIWTNHGQTLNPRRSYVKVHFP